MKQIVLIAFITTTFFSCDSEKETDMDALNTASKKCISIANEAEANKNNALANGNVELAAKYQTTMDSAFRENALIGQKMLSADKDD